MTRLMRMRCTLLVTMAALLTCGQGCPNANNNGGGGGNGGGNEDKGLPGESARAAVQSQCAQNVIVCTVSFPKAEIDIAAAQGQTVTPTAKGFIVQGSNNDGSEVVNLIGSNSTAGQGATQLSYSWSQAAHDTNPLTLAPGPVFSSAPNPSVRMAEGFHYVRLTVQNDIFRDEILSPAGDVILTNVYLSDFKEIEIEVRD